MRNAEAERFVRQVWEVFVREGVAGVLPFFAADAHLQPHSAGGRRFRSLADYREELERFTAAGHSAEASATGIWSHGSVVVLRGRLRIRRGGDVIEDTRMYWLFEVRGEQLVHVASSPDLAGLLREVGEDDPVVAREAFIALHRKTALG